MKRSVDNGFQLDKSYTLSSACDTKRRVKQRKGPSYRKINTYFKSIKQYQKERNRRNEVMELAYVQFLNQKEIATKLGISVSTVKRDLRKVRRFIQGQTNRAIRAMHEERETAFRKGMEGLSLREQFDYLSAEMDRYKKIWQNREYNHHVIKFFINLDYIKYDGFPRLTVWPRGQVECTEPHILKFIYIKDGREYETGSVIIDRVQQRRSWF